MALWGTRAFGRVRKEAKSHRFSQGYCIINLRRRRLLITAEYKFSILTEVEEEQAALERVRELED